MSQAAPFLQSASAMFDAVGQSNALRGSAAADKDNAHLALLQGAYNEEDIRRRGRAVQGEAISALAEGGNDVGSGSAADLIYQNSLEIEYAALGARYSAANEARGYRYKAAQEKQAAKMALIGGVLRAGAAAVTGASTARNAAAQDAAFARRQDALYPGAQRLPLPPPSFSSLPPIFGPGYSLSYGSGPR